MAKQAAVEIPTQRAFDAGLEVSELNLAHHAVFGLAATLDVGLASLLHAKLSRRRCVQARRRNGARD